MTFFLGGGEVFGQAIMTMEKWYKKLNIGENFQIW